MEIGEIKETPKDLETQSWRRGPRIKGPLRLAIEKLNLRQSFSVLVGEGEDRNRIRDKIASARKQVSMQCEKRFMVNAVGDSEFVVSRTK